ncbi:MAG TPA: DivIVA domain-containing protein [Actinomycetota bacterium]|nr:DivIVA domain-containing protein [Actinomycetota bacterium]
MDPEEIENRQFIVTLRGYARDEVEAFREEVAQEIRLLRKQLTKATSDLSHTTSELERVKSELAQANADLASERSRPALGPQERLPEDRAAIFKLLGQETERILLAAEEAAEQMHERAVKESAEMMADARMEVQRSMEELEAARRAAEEDFAEISDSRSMVASQLEDIGRRLEETINRLRVPVELPGPKSARARMAQAQQSVADRPAAAAPNPVQEAENAAQLRRQREAEAAAELAARQTAHVEPARQREDELRAVQAEAERKAREAERRARQERREAVRREQELRAAAAAADAERLKAAREADQRKQEEAEREARADAQRARAAAERASRAEAERKDRLEAERVAREEAERTAREEAERVAREEADRAAREEAERVARVEAEQAARAEAERVAEAETTSRQQEPAKASAHRGSTTVAAAAPEAAAAAADTAAAASSLDALLEEIRRKRESGHAPASAAMEPDSRPTGDEITRRNEALGNLPSQTARRLKRLLQEDHNDLLDRLRKQRGRGSLDENLAPPEEQVQRFVAGLRDALAKAFNEGRRAAGAKPAADPTQAVAKLVSRQVVTPLRNEVSRAVGAGLEAEDSASALSERANDVFRVWKGVRTQLLGEGIALSAYHHGFLDALGSRSDARKAWVLAEDEQDCPNDVCRRNASAGAVGARAAFPSGHHAPPAHGGCTCTLKGA